MPLVHTGIIPNQMLSPNLRTKRCCSEDIATNTADDTTAVFYTTAGCIIKAINVYTVAQIQGAAFKLDVGIQADDDAIVSAYAIGATAVDTVVNVPAASWVTAVVAATKSVTASVETADGTGGTIRVSIDYEEVGA